MSQFIFDEIYGSQAKRKKIMESTNYLYYRQMMKIKDNHTKNKPLYQQLYHLPNNQQTIYQSPLPKKIKRQGLFFAMNQNNYTVQKINSHAFKIIKERRRSKINAYPSQEVNLKNWAVSQGYPIDTKKRITSRTIDSDARKLRTYLQMSEQKIKRPSKSRIRNYSVELTRNDNKPFSVSSKFDKNESDISTLSPSLYKTSFSLKNH